MKVQNTPGIAVQMMQAQTQAAAAPPETPFQDLLSGAMQAGTPPAKQAEEPQGGEPEAPAQDPAPAQSEKPGQSPEPTPDSPEAETDEAALQNAVAMIIVPQIVLLPELEEQALPIVAPAQTVPVQAVPVETMQAPPAETLPVETQPALQEAVVQESPQPGANPQPSQNESGGEAGNGIVSAELVEEPQPPVAAEQPPAVGAAPESEAQSRFDAMIREASSKLQGKEPVMEAPEQAEAVIEEAPKAAPQLANRTIPAELRRKSEISEETLAMAAPHAVEAAPEEPELQTQAPRQTGQPAPTPASQVETQVTRQLEEGRMEFHMQLNPLELGRVSVKMVLEDGKLAVQIAAAGEKALEALRKESDGLMASLRTQGIQVETVNVVSEPQTASGQMGSPFGTAMGQRQDDGSAGQGKASANTGSAQGADAAAEPLPREVQPDRLLDTAV